MLKRDRQARNKARNRRSAEERKCLECGKIFHPMKYKPGKYCSNRCSGVAGPRPLQIPLRKRFWRYVKKNGPALRPELGPCWMWTGANDGKAGYGKITVEHKPGRQIRTQAHRASWMLHFGKIPPGLEVCHECDNPPCIRPEHLFLGNRAANQQDAARKGHKGKLTAHQAGFIKRLTPYREEGTGRVLGKMFQVSPSLISMIFCGKRWAHI
jgi:hypothetical protein